MSFGHPDSLLRRLNNGEASPLLKSFAKEYATTGKIRYFRDRPKQDREEIHADLKHFQLTAIIGFNRVGYHLSDVPPRDGVFRALSWLTLYVMVEDGIRLGICPEPGCHRFFVDSKNRGKSACSPEHGNRLRARTYVERLKKDPRKYRRYLKRQRELMQKRRAAGLA